ncbi:hypothetical protein EDB87DRAFT_1707417 [Lactarius vividus]|nr:hypothetical protein EDB87DRAFT_1707417 [Lactarius vividus]
MTITPGDSLHPLMRNPLLTRVAILLVKGAFLDYLTVYEHLNVEPPQEAISTSEVTVHIWSARTYCARLSASGIRAGFRPLSTTTSELRLSVRLMRTIPPLSIGDTIGTRPTTSTISTTLRQTLEPTGKDSSCELHDLVTSGEYSSILVEIESLQDFDDATSKKARPDLLPSPRNFKLAALKKYREQQRDNSFRTFFQRPVFLHPRRLKHRRGIFVLLNSRIQALRLALHLPPSGHRLLNRHRPFTTRTTTPSIPSPQQLELVPEKDTQSDKQEVVSCHIRHCSFQEAETYLSFGTSRYGTIPVVGFHADRSRDDALGHPGRWQVGEDCSLGDF